MKKQTSIRQLVLGWGIFYTALLIVLISAAILYLERAASESLIRQELWLEQKEVRKNLKLQSDGTVSLSKEYTNELRDFPLRSIRRTKSLSSERSRRAFGRRII